MNEFITCFKKYAVFKGRARRREYWMFYLFSIISAIIITVLDLFIGIKVGEYGILTIIFGLILFIPTLSVAVRRLHDVDKSGWMMFISLIPIIGGIWLLILFVTSGTIGDNKYGSDPKMVQLGITSDIPVVAPEVTNGPIA